MKRLPLRFFSRLWGEVSQKEIPEKYRSLVYGTYARVFGCNLDEMEEEKLENFPTIASFFSRKLKPNCRPLGPGMVSPADGTVLHFGEVFSDSVEQVKGLEYSLKALLGPWDPLIAAQIEREKRKRLSPSSMDVLEQNEIQENDDRWTEKRLYHCVIYLSPGDYHRFHAPEDIQFESRTHFPGNLLPVAPYSAHSVDRLFEVNERVSLSGEWAHGRVSFVPVGAYNVGSIVLNFDKELITNGKVAPSTAALHKHYSSPFDVRKGDEIGAFLMGSTIVLLFESPPFQFNLLPGQRIRLGESLGRLVGPSAQKKDEQ